MRKTKSILNLILLSYCITCVPTMAQENEVPDKIKPYVHYEGTFFSNMYGGLKNGGGYCGYAQIGFGVETEEIGLWRGGEFRIGGANNHGAMPSSEYVGDFQGVLNSENAMLTYMQDLWYSQQFGNFSVKVGLQKLDESFAVCDASGEFLNGAFGTSSVIASNMEVPIFPLSALGTEISCNIGERWSVSMCAYDGVPTQPDDDPYNIMWKTGKSEGCLLATEAAFSPQIGDLQGTYKAGFLYHSGENHNPHVIYASLQQTVWQSSGGRSITPFLYGSALLSPPNQSSNHLHLSGGVSMEKVFSKNGEDALGLGFSSAFFKNGNGTPNLDMETETSVECVYSLKPTKLFSLKLDLQCIINPNGGADNLKNCFVGFLQFCFELD